MQSSFQIAITSRIFSQTYRPMNQGTICAKDSMAHLGDIFCKNYWTTYSLFYHTSTDEVLVRD